MKILALAILSVILLGSCGKSPDAPDVIVQYQKDTTVISNYVKQNSPAATKLDAGVWFTIDAASEGMRATFDDSVVMTYTMKLLSNGTVVDQSSSPKTFNLSGTIAGIQIAMPYFQKGSKGKIFIPSLYGYRDTGYGSVPPNSVLIFEFELTDVVDSYLKTDTVAINNYIRNNHLNASLNINNDPSGLRFSVDTIGGGAIPTIHDRVIVNYSISLLSGQTTPTAQTILPFTTMPATRSLQDYILAWEIIFASPQVGRVGSYYTIYVPSSLAFGPNTVENLSNQTRANLVYKVKILGLANQ